MPWAKSVMIERKLPDTIRIFIDEHEPKAVWHQQGNFFIINAEGNVITKINNQQMANFADLIVIMGENAKANIASLYSFIEEDSGIYDIISFAEYIGNRRWNIGMINDILIKLPATDADDAWQYLLDLHEKLNILYGNIKVIDLRIPDKVFIELDTQYKQNRILLKEVG